MKSKEFYLECKDHSVSGETFRLTYDHNKDMLVTETRPENLEEYYKSEAYISHTDSNKTVIEKLYQAVKIVNLKSKTQLINKYSNDEKCLLDVGAGTGDFLIAAQKKGWKTIGVEPNHKAREKAKEKGVEVVAHLETVAKKKFNTITLWHVLEHLPDLEEQIKVLTGLLSENGTLIIAVPNYKSYDAIHYKQYWAAFDVPRHLWHFSKQSIEVLFGEHGFKIIKTKPMLYDAFYVSILSEKYKSKKQRFIKALWIGLKSNFLGWRSKEYSSHIYILKKE
ncbi:methyltransferase [Arenibacter sp. H213]|uniref:Class I SAM-dependent methyltransferase n=1 Tax=Arenibacter antarcticus TaxID=2040469 RepID=A0ABW5V9B3_9FLAO|nr:class I SAM-dependent methyltransferase [Arenibacter sp. H213]MCM4167855.1 methyltransferase [Arenibacter sp. H213]